MFEATHDPAVTPELAALMLYNPELDVRIDLEHNKVTVVDKTIEAEVPVPEAVAQVLLAARRNSL